MLSLSWQIYWDNCIYCPNTHYFIINPNVNYVYQTRVSVRNNYGWSYMMASSF